MFDFPNSPTVGQTFDSYSWDGEKWKVVADSGSTIAPSDASPTMDGAAAPGVATLYSRGDHVHPTDTSRAAVSALPAPATVAPLVEGTAAVGASVKYAREDHVHPSGGGAGVTPAALTRTNDANVTLTLGGTPATALLQATSMTMGWSGTLAAARGGFGADVSAQSGVPLFSSGTATFTGTTGTGNFARAADPVFTGNPTAPTPAAGDNDTSIATTAFITGAIATAAQYRNNTAGKTLTTDQVWLAAAVVTLTDAATVTPDFATGFDFIWTIGATGRTIANPSNPKPGQKGMIYLVQDGAGSRTITTWGSQYKFPGGVKPTLSTAASAVDDISYVVKSSTEIHCFFSAGMA